MKILDCTLRDGGYYTNWDFSDSLVDAYVEAMNSLPVDYLELGYRNVPQEEYLGKFGYSSVSVLQHIRQKSTKRLAVMLNEKSCREEDLPSLLSPLVGLIDMIRIAVDPKNFMRAISLAKAIKAYGFEVAFNTMYMSKWNEYPDFLHSLKLLNGVVDMFCMVDSFGSVTPEVVRERFSEVKNHTSCLVGFHGHNNLQLGLFNTLTAIECGADFVDCTIMGMGRGAGNLNTELLLTYLNKQIGLKVNFNALGEVVTTFMPLFEQYRWGTNLPYMLSGANSLPQKEVMEWVSNRRYSPNSIVQTLVEKSGLKTDESYPIYDNHNRYKSIVLIGGGKSIEKHIEGIKEFVKSQDSVALIFATARHAVLFSDIVCPKFYVLVGEESKRLQKNVSIMDGVCILPPSPRTMYTDVPSTLRDRTYELQSVEFVSEYLDSCTTIGLQLAIDICEGCIYVAGYDGYSASVLAEKEATLSRENRAIFDSAQKYQSLPIISLTPTLYKELIVKSVYQYLK